MGTSEARLVWWMRVDWFVEEPLQMQKGKRFLLGNSHSHDWHEATSQSAKSGISTWHLFLWKPWVGSSPLFPQSELNHYQVWTRLRELKTNSYVDLVQGILTGRKCSLSLILRSSSSAGLVFLSAPTEEFGEFATIPGWETSGIKEFSWCDVYYFASTALSWNCKANKHTAKRLHDSH